MNYVKFFKELGKEDVPLVGGKGANLGELYNSGFNVPNGFVVSTKGFQEVMNSKIEDKIKEKLEDLDIENHDQLQVFSEELKSLFLKEIPKEVEEEIREAYKKLGEPLVAVRSSATSEDADKTSFAGQFTTFLNISDAEELIEMVKECWASLFNPRVLMYQDAHEISPLGTEMAVVVQKMIDSNKSGVCFSQTPVGDKSEVLIEGAFGLGEAVVSGSITPDEYRVGRENREITKIKVNKQSLYHTKENNETVEKELTEEKQEQQVLGEREILEIADLALRIEDHYGKPQDIEWCYSEGGLYLLQSRPITA